MNKLWNAGAPSSVRASGMRWRLLAVVSTLVAAAMLAAAASSSAATATRSGTATKASTFATINVALTPFKDSAALIVGVEHHIFARNGLAVHIEVASSGPAIAADVLSNHAQFGDSGTISMLGAQVKGAPVTVVAQTASSGSGVDEGLFVMKNSSIHAAKDLNGKTIGLNALKAQNELFVRAAAAKLGADPNTFNVVALPLPSMVDALKAGQVDAAYLNEPYATQARDAGARVLIAQPANLITGERHPMLSVWFTSSSYASANRRVVQAFVRSVKQSNVFANTHLALVRKVLPSYAQLPQSLANRIVLSTFGTSIDLKTLQAMGTEMVRFGFVPQMPDVNALIWH